MAHLHSPAEDRATPDTAPHFGIDPSSLRIDLWLFVGMLALALGGVAVTQIEHTGGKLYWVFLVGVYAAISLGRTWIKHRHDGLPMWSMLRHQVYHWVGTMVAINIVLWFEVQGITDRGPASDFSVLILALSCYLAGVHYSWPFMLLGGVLAIIAIGLGFLDQLSIFALAIPAAALAVWVVVRHTATSKR
jgi:hypothetical protein